MKPRPDRDIRRKLATLAIATGRPEDRFDPDVDRPYVADFLSMIRGERPPIGSRERRALRAYRRNTENSRAAHHPDIVGDVGP